MSRSLQVIAHNIRSAHNVGAVLRMADSLGVAKVWITGFSPTPENVRVSKTALGAESTAVWEHRTDVLEVIRELREQGHRIVGLEIDPRAVDLVSYMPAERSVLLMGNEVDGLAPSLRELCDDLVMMSQKGTKESMNVAMATAIVSYWMLNRP